MSVDDRRVFGTTATSSRPAATCSPNCIVGLTTARGSQNLQQLARQVGLPLVAAGDVHYHVPARMVLHDVLTAIRHGTTVAAAEGTAALSQRRAASSRSADEMAARSSPLPRMPSREPSKSPIAAASRSTSCATNIRRARAAGQTPLEYLTQLTWQGAANVIPDGVPPQVRESARARAGADRELRYEAYFLTVWDLVRFARSRNILCQGRGSAANSAVCYCLGVTAVDPDTD